MILKQLPTLKWIHLKNKWLGWLDLRHNLGIVFGGIFVSRKWKLILIQIRSKFFYALRLPVFKNVCKTHQWIPRPGTCYPLKTLSRRQALVQQFPPDAVWALFLLQWGLFQQPSSLSATHFAKDSNCFYCNRQSMN